MSSADLLQELRDLLKHSWNVKSHHERYFPLLETLKAETNDSQLKNRIWLYSALLESHMLYLNVFELLKSGNFYPAWCDLEKLEISLAAIGGNKEHLDDDFGQSFLNNAVSTWQTLFPYRLFFSSREIFKKIRCSICERPRSVLQGCGHRKGKLYSGEYCSDVIEDFELIGFDAVSNPVRKSSVPFSPDGDQYDYTLLRSVLKVVTTPRHQFSAYVTGTPLIGHTGVNSPSFACPCMRSVRNYEDCCLPLLTIETNHINLVFHLPMQACATGLPVVTCEIQPCIVGIPEST
jgi:hypothetical protein